MILRGLAKYSMKRSIARSLCDARRPFVDNTSRYETTVEKDVSQIILSQIDLNEILMD